MRDEAPKEESIFENMMQDLKEQKQGMEFDKNGKLFEEGQEDDDDDDYD